MGMLLFICLLCGLAFYLGRVTAPKHKIQTLSNQSRPSLSYAERQRRKVLYVSDADRIRELNRLSANDSIFLRLLKQQFIHQDIIIKQKRFFIVDSDQYPIAIFEYRDGTKSLHDCDTEDGLPVFLYKAILSSDIIRQDAEVILKNKK